MTNFGSRLTSELSNLTGVGLSADTPGSAAEHDEVVGVSLCLTLSSASLSLTSTSSLHDKSMVLPEKKVKNSELKKFNSLKSKTRKICMVIHKVTGT